MSVAEQHFGWGIFVVTTAQETFKLMMREGVAPRLRELGFRGSGQSYHIPSDTHFAQIGFQKDRYSNKELVRFTINVSVVSSDDWAEHRSERPGLPPRPSASTSYGRPQWWERLGMLTPKRRDDWWELRAGEVWWPVAFKVVNAVETYALPAMQARMDGN